MSINRTKIGVALAALLVMAASAALLVRDYRAEAANHRQVMLARGQTALDALAAGIRAQGRMGRYRHDRLSLIFEELARTQDIVGVALHTAGGDIISAGGETEGMTPGADEVTHWERGALRLRRAVSLELGGHGPGGGRGPFGGPNAPEAGDWESLPEGPLALTVLLDTTAMEAEISGDRLRLGVSLAGAMLLVCAGSIAALGMLRRRQLQTELLVAREQAAHQEQLTRLGAGLAHETKNPLGIVRGHAQLIADAPDDTAENRARAERIVDEIDRAVGHIDGFLTLARPHDIDPQPIALGPVLEDIGRLLEGEAKQHRVLLSIAAPDIRVVADEGALRKALLNLLLNAFRACSPGDRVDVKVKGDRGRVTLSVQDTGCGIAPEDLPRVTEPYFTRVERGSGLGLALVEQIARAHGWRLAIDSTPGVGTSVLLEGMEKAGTPHA